MITIRKSPTADTRTCDYRNVSKEELLDASHRHISDVYSVLYFLILKLNNKGMEHDRDKIADIDQFHADFKEGFKTTTWWDAHRRNSRHHLNHEDGVPEDVDLLDVLEYIVDCVVAGKARSGEVYPLQMSEDLLMKAFQNMVEKITNAVSVEEDHPDSEKEGDTESTWRIC